MSTIRANDLPADATPSSSDVTIVDGLTTRKTTLEQLVNAGRPFASQAEAEAGTDTTKAMNPLTVAQAVAAQGASQFATAAQGVLADTAVQPGDLSTVATTGAYADLSGLPTLGTAAATAASDYATAAQGTKADSAVQSVAAGAGISVDATDPNNLIVSSTGAGTGDMLAATYDPQAINDDAFDRVNHTGEQAISTITGLQTALVQRSIRGHIFGLTLSNNATDATNDIDIATGEAASTETNPVLLKLESATTKRLDAAWAVGTGNGGRDTGSIADGVWYVWLIGRSDTGVVDVLFSLSKTNPTMPASYDQKRRIGSFIRYSGAIKAFVQTGDRFEMSPSIPDITAAALSTTAQTPTVSLPPSMVGLFRARVSPGAGSNCTVIISGQSISANSFEASLQCTESGGADASEFAIRVTDDGKIGHRATGTVSGSTITITSYGWIDTRGKDA